MLTLDTTIYKCEFCKKYLIKKHAAIKHEFNCYKNPKNHSACVGCIFINVEPITYLGGHDYYGERTDIKGNQFKCEKLNKTMYPFVLVKKGVVEKHPEQFEGQEQMPSNCKDWKC